MKIIRLQAENIKRLVAVEITPDGHVVQLTGRNAQGKSSILDAIWWALGGEKAIQDDPIRHGADKAQVRLDLGEMVVRRTFTPAGTTLTVTNAEGLKYPSPQKVLDALIGKMAFDPVQFIRADEKQQFATLRKLVKLDEDIDALEREYLDLYQQRRDQNRETDRLMALATSCVVDDENLEPKSAATLVTEINAALEANKANERRRSTLTKAKEKSAAIHGQLEQAREHVRLLEAELESARKDDDELERVIGSIVDADVSALQAQIADIENHNRKAIQAAQYRKSRSDAKDSKEKADALTEKMESIQARKLAALSKAEFPLPGLSFDNGRVTYNGVPIAQASQAEQIRISMAIAMAGNPKLRIIRITDGSLLDSDNMKVIEEMAEAHDWQCWIEKVDESGDVGIVIEDGMVVTKDAAA